MKQFLYFLFTWWKGQTLGTWWHTRTNGEFVGEDEFGNRYYRTKGGKIDPGLGVQRRWVIYKDDADASAIPPGWHGWMHQRTDVPPSEEKGYAPWSWQKPHQPNQTGTAAAYRPQGSILGTGRRAEGGAYRAWQPK